MFSYFRFLVLAASGLTFLGSAVTWGGSRTLARSACPEAFVSAPVSTWREDEPSAKEMAKARYAAPEVLNQIYAWAREEDHAGFSLETPHDASATGYFKRFFKGEGFRYVRTRQSLGRSVHFYLLREDYFGPGRHLIVDPTIRQFHQPPQFDIVPPIFVGDQDDLLALLVQTGQQALLEKFVDTQFAE